MFCKATEFMYEIDAYSFEKTTDLKFINQILHQKVIFYTDSNKQVEQVHWLPITEEE